MRVGNFNSQRPQYYDRNQTPIVKSYSATINTTQVNLTTSIYTVPAGKKFLLSSARYFRVNSGALSAGDGVSNGGIAAYDGTTYWRFLDDVQYELTQGASHLSIMPGGLILSYGWSLVARFTIGITTGAVLFRMQVNGNEFDA